MVLVIEIWYYHGSEVLGSRHQVWRIDIKVSEETFTSISEAVG
jgi:hypothetical protein